MSITHRMWKLLLAVGLTFLAGIIGYEVIEGWSFLDATYMTVITLATIGYGETHPLTDQGRIFTIFLILGGMTTVSYGALSLTALVADGELMQLLKRRRMDKAIAQLQDHYIICGFGKTGEHVVTELLKTDRQVVVVDKDPENLRCFHARQTTIDRLGAGIGDTKVHYLAGDAASDHVLTGAGIQRAAGIFCALASTRTTCLWSSPRAGSTSASASSASAKRTRPSRSSCVPARTASSPPSASAGCGWLRR